LCSSVEVVDRRKDIQERFAQRRSGRLSPLT
jgi:hypothetical protein